MTGVFIGLEKNVFVSLRQDSYLPQTIILISTARHYSRPKGSARNFNPCPASVTRDSGKETRSPFLLKGNQSDRGRSIPTATNTRVAERWAMASQEQRGETVGHKSGRGHAESPVGPGLEILGEKPHPGTIESKTAENSAQNLDHFPLST